MIQLILSISLTVILISCHTLEKTNLKDLSSKTGGGRKVLTLNNKTRGGTTRGTPVTHDKTVSPFSKEIIQAKTKKEKDRLAILSQTGEYQVHFEFLETIILSKAKSELPYYSWSTEYIFPIANEENFISLQHILVVKMEGFEKAHVIKHWRQDWTYEDPVILEYQGYYTWKKKKLPDLEVKGKWSQAVYQVDDSPRYKTYGAWTHHSNFSQWVGMESNRPLPRREFSVRSDYQVLRGINTLTIASNAWYHEQNNFKAIVDVSDLKVRNYLAKETGLNRYEQIKGFDFSEGKKYWKNTKDYWKEVRAKWEELIKSKDIIKLKNKVNGKELHEVHFEFAQKLMNKNKLSPEEIKEHAKSTITHFLDE